MSIQSQGYRAPAGSRKEGDICALKTLALGAAVSFVCGIHIYFSKVNDTLHPWRNWIMVFRTCGKHPGKTQLINGQKVGL